MNPRSYFGRKTGLWVDLNDSMFNQYGIRESYDSSISRAARGIFELHWMPRTQPVVATPTLCFSHLRGCSGCSKSGRQIWFFVNRIINNNNIRVQDACNIIQHDEAEETVSETQVTADAMLHLPSGAEESETQVTADATAASLLLLPSGAEYNYLQHDLSLPGLPGTDDLQEFTGLAGSGCAVQSLPVLPSAAVPQESMPLPAAVAAITPSAAMIPATPSIAPALRPRWAPRSVFDMQVEYQWRKSLQAAFLRNKQTPTMKRARFTLFDVDYERVQLTGTVCKFKLLFDFDTGLFPSASVKKLREQLEQKDSDDKQKGVRFVFQVLMNKRALSFYGRSGVLGFFLV